MPKVAEQRTDAQVTSNLIRLATVPMAYPGRKFGEDEVAPLKRSIKGRILELKLQPLLAKKEQYVTFPEIEICG
jgi:hypothetical protein